MQILKFRNQCKFVFIVDSSVMLPKSRRARGMNMNSAKQKPILQLYNKLCELVSLIGDLVSMENLTDIIILKVSVIVFLFHFFYINKGDEYILKL